MIAINPIPLTEIETNLIALGSGNHKDNLRSIRDLPRYYTALLTECEFLHLVFLSNDAVRSIAPLGQDRRLRAVAQRALEAPRPQLGPNWDLTVIRCQTASFLSTKQALPPLLLRDARNNETGHGAQWYLQDGSHRALGYAMAILSGVVSYVPLQAHVATVRFLEGSAA